MLQSLHKVLELICSLFLFLVDSVATVILNFVPQGLLNNIWLALLAFVPKTKGHRNNPPASGEEK